MTLQDLADHFFPFLTPNCRLALVIRLFEIHWQTLKSNEEHKPLTVKENP